MGGSIGVSSVEGKGSEFWFTVPFKIGKAGVGQVSPDDLKDLSVLVVEDNAVARAALSDTVKAMGWHGEMVDMGEKAIERLRARKKPEKAYDVMLIDWQMPGMDGLDTSRRIRQDRTLQQPPIVILVTAFSREDVLQVSDSETIDAVLVKPVTPSSLLDAVAQAMARRAGSEPVAQIEPPGGSRLAGTRILLVEDNLINQDVAKRILEHEGASVTVISDGLQAVQLLSQKKDAFDLVLMDVQMPGMGGIEATTQIREELNLRTLPIIALTAGALAGERESCLAAGMNDFIAKPFNVDQLVEEIRRHAGLRPALQPPEAQTQREKNEFPAIPGFDAQQAKTRLAGDRRLFISLVRRMADQFDGIAELVRSQLKAGNRKEALGLMHTLKGVAGNVSAVEIARLASVLEAAIHAEDDVSAFLLHLDQAMDEMQAVVRNLSLDEESENDKVDISFSLEDLLSLLEARNLSALDQFGVLRTLVASRYGEENHAELARAIESLDFPAAAAKLRDLLQTTSVSC